VPIALHFRDGRLRLRVRVAPGARRPGIVGAHGEALKVRVQSPPERGRANRELCALLADLLGVPAGNVAVVAGTTSRNKTVEVAGIDPETARSRLRDL